MQTRVFLIRHGITDWHHAGKLLGRRDIPLNDEGLAQGVLAADALAGITIAEVLSSPLQRALQTAELISKRHGIQVARDARLTDFEVGRWAGMSLEDIAAQPVYLEFLANPMSTHIPEGESLEQVRRRAVAAIEQILADNPSGDAIAVITHSGVIRVLLAHYMGAPPATYHRLRVSPGSISVLSFSHEGSPRVLACNWSSSLESGLRGAGLR